MNRFSRMARPALCFALLLFLLIGCAAPQESPAPTATEAPKPTAAPAVTRNDPAGVMQKFLRFFGFCA